MTAAIDDPNYWEPDDDEPEAEPTAPALRVVAASAGSAPTSDDPLRGLVHLGPIAVIGAQRIRDLAAAPVNWSWQDYATASSIVVLAGPPGGGKTTLLFLLMLARAASGDPIALLARAVKPAPQGRFVVLIEGEHDEESASRKLVKSARLLRLGDAALDRIVLVARKAVTLGSKEWRDVERMIGAGLVSDVALDTIARCAPSDANNEQEQTAIFAKVAAALERAPVGARPTAWLVAHTRKDSGGDLDDVSGSAQRVGQADSVIMVLPVRDAKSKRVEGSVITLVKARGEPDDYPRAVTLELDGEKLSHTIASTKEEREHAKANSLRGRVLAAIRDNPGIGAAELRRAIEGATAAAVDHAVACLLFEVEIEDRGTRGERAPRQYHAVDR